MIKVKEMKKLIERVEEFGEYQILIEESLFFDGIDDEKEKELELKLDHHDHCVIIGLKK